MILCAGIGFTFAPERTIVTVASIAAPPERVWAVLTDTASYPAWNPDMRLRGRLEAGRVIEYAAGQGADRMVFFPRVLVARPGVMLRWHGSLWFPRVFDADHTFLMSPDGSGTRFVQGEYLRGVGLWLFDTSGLRSGFTVMNEALKRRAEAP